MTWSTTYQSLSLGYLVTKQSAIFSLLFDDPNLPLSPLVPADSNKAKKKAMFSGFHFVHQHYSIATEGMGGVLFTATSSILMFYPAQQVWQHYSEHISARLWRNHMLSPLCWQTQREQPNTCWPIFTGHLSSRSFLLDYKKKMYNTLHHLWVVKF